MRVTGELARLTYLEWQTQMKKIYQHPQRKACWSFRETSGNVMSQMAMWTGGLKYGRFDHEWEHITVGKSSQMLQKGLDFYYKWKPLSRYWLEIGMYFLMYRQYHSGFSMKNRQKEVRVKSQRNWRLKQ